MARVVTSSAAIACTGKIIPHANIPALIASKVRREIILKNIIMCHSKPRQLGNKNLIPLILLGAKRNHPIRATGNIVITVPISVGATATSGTNSATATGGGDPACPTSGATAASCTGTTPNTYGTSGGVPIIDAVNAAPYRDKEIIIVDDYSEDGTRDKLKNEILGYIWSRYMKEM